MRKSRREGRGIEQETEGLAMDLSHRSWPLTPTTPTSVGPYPRTFDQQLEGPSATKEGDRGHGGLTCVGASGIKGDGAE